MSKVIQAKHKIDRRLGVNLWGRSKSPFNVRAYGPGQHGQRRGKPSDYATQLMAKQKLKGYYGRITEKQFKRVFKEAERRRGDTGENLIELLERRLDAVVYRACFTPTIFGARQLVSHGHVKVNGIKVDVASYTVKDGDVVELSEKARSLPLVLQAVQSNERSVPEYLEVNVGAFTCKFIRRAGLADVPYPVTMEPNLVIEFYSR